jgi:hypothetical protein
MPKTRTLEQAFNGGELTPEFYGRIEDAKYQTGLATCQNWEVLPHGPVRNRAGFRKVNTVKNSAKATRVIPFNYSSTQTMVIELGDGYARFHTNGAPLKYPASAVYQGGIIYDPGTVVSYLGNIYTCIAQNQSLDPTHTAYWYQLPNSGEYEIPTPYAAADVMGLHYVQSNDVLTLVHPLYPPAELRRYGATDWRYVPISFTTKVAAPIGVTVFGTNAPGSSNFQLYDYAVTAISPDGTEESALSAPAASYFVTQINGISQASPASFTCGFGLSYAVVGQRVRISGVGGMTQLNGNDYLIGTMNATTIAFGTYNTSPITTMTLTNLDGTPLDTTSFSAFTSGGTLTLYGVTNNLFATGASNSLSWSAVQGASSYIVYKKSQGIWAFCGQTSATSFQDVNIAADIGAAAPTANNPFVGVGNYPSAVSYFEQRRCFAGTINAPSSLWMTKAGTESNMNSSIPYRATDAIAIRVAARENNPIRHLVPLNYLIPLTAAAEWRVASVNSDAITPSSISVKPQSYIGANNTQPVVINNSLVYTSARGGHMRELGYSWQANGYVTGDLSLRAPHLFDSYDVVDMAYSKAPYPFVWCVSSSGKLLGFTYIPEQQIGAWHQHTTGAADVFESCCVVAEGSRDVLYVVTNRNINGVQVRFIERQADRLFVVDDDEYLVDCGVTYIGAPTAVLTGIAPWLAGMRVSVLADGAVIKQQVVAFDGSIVLPVAANTVHVGLPIMGILKTLPNAEPQIPGLGQGRPKNVDRAFLRLVNSRGVKVGPTMAKLTEWKERTVEPYGSPVARETREIEVVLGQLWSDSGQIYIVADLPVAATLVSLCYEVDIGG